jgi:hypothetical protein
LRGGRVRRLIRAAGFHILSTGYLWQTFENISGRQPRLVALAAPWLRRLASALERTPGVRAFGTSQVIVAARGVGTAAGADPGIEVEST